MSERAAPNPESGGGGVPAVSAGGMERSSQPHSEVVPEDMWWWLAHISISTVALVANLVFLLTVIYNR